MIYFIKVRECIDSVLANESYDSIKKKCKDRGYNSRDEAKKKTDDFSKFISRINTYSLYLLRDNRFPYTTLMYSLLTVFIFYISRFWFKWLFRSKNESNTI